jgi:hypothetical protein
MPRYNVETRLPPEMVEAAEMCPSFNAAMQWLVGRLNENPLADRPHGRQRADYPRTGSNAQPV